MRFHIMRVKQPVRARTKERCELRSPHSSPCLEWGKSLERYRAYEACWLAPAPSHMGSNYCPGSWGMVSTSRRSPRAPERTTPERGNREATWTCHSPLIASSPGDQPLGLLRFFSQRREQIKTTGNLRRGQSPLLSRWAFRSPNTPDVGGNVAWASLVGWYVPVRTSKAQPTWISGLEQVLCVEGQSQLSLTSLL